MLNGPKPDVKKVEERLQVATMFINAYMLGAEHQAALTGQPVQKEGLKKCLKELKRQNDEESRKK